MESDYLLTLGAISPASISNELPSGWTVNSERSAAWTRKKPYSSIPTIVTCCELPSGPVTVTSAPLSNKGFTYYRVCSAGYFRGQTGSQLSKMQNIKYFMSKNTNKTRLLYIIVINIHNYNINISLLSILFIYFATAFQLSMKEIID